MLEPGEPLNGKVDHVRSEYIYLGDFRMLAPCRYKYAELRIQERITREEI